MKILLPIRKLHGKIHENRINRNNGKKISIKYLSKPKGRKVYVIGTPDHTNLGDSAIAAATISFLSELFARNRIKEVPFYQFLKQKDVIIKCIKKCDLIVQLGGGNMGDVWIGEEVFRRDVIESFPDNPMMIFPQTVYYTSTEEGNREKQDSIKVYNGRSKLVLTAREKHSYEEMRRLYPDTEVLLVPDIVLSAPKDMMQISPKNRNGALFCIRSDKEGCLDAKVVDELRIRLEAMGVQCRFTDMLFSENVNYTNRDKKIKEKLEEISSAKLVITDRLHGMVFSVITGTPCIAFSNHNHKIEQTAKWFENIRYVRFVKNLEMAETALAELLQMENTAYDNNIFAKEYETLRGAIKRLCQK